MQSIDAVQGTPGQGNDIASLLGKLQDQFSTLLNDPASAPQQSQVVWAATTLAQGINTLSDAYATQRQTAQDNIGTEVATLNTTLGTIGGLSNKIVTLKAGGQSTADLENQRDAAMADLSQLLDVKALEQPNGDLMVVTSAGLVLPIHGATNPFATVGVNVQPGTFYPGGGINGITLGGADVTSQLRGGQIGANIALRDTTLPTDQAELDEFAQNLASRFNGVGPDAVHRAGRQRCRPRSAAAAGAERLCRLRRHHPGESGGAGRPIDGARRRRPAGAGARRLHRHHQRGAEHCTFGANQPLALPWPTSQACGLGRWQSERALLAPPTLGGIASTMLASQAQDSAATSTQADTEQAVQTTLASKLSAQSGVNMDTEMSNMIQLQNAYGANARVIAAVQAMWDQLLQSVR